MPDDQLSIYKLADEALARYVASRAGRAGMLGAGAAALRSQAELVGSNAQAIDAATSAYEGALMPTPNAQDADEARWRSWWGAAPGTAYERLKGLGSAAQGAYLKSRKGSGKRRGGGGGGGLGPTPIPVPWAPPGLEGPGGGGTTPFPGSNPYAGPSSPYKDKTRYR